MPEGFTEQQAQLNEDSESWAATVAEMDAATVRRWCLDRARSGDLPDWSWWDGVAPTTGWERARVAFVAWAEMLDLRQPTNPPPVPTGPWGRYRRTAFGQ
ncbi:MAG: hypothetical protein ACT4QG_01070 [Sporichthyaceae bacterium]